MLGERIGIGRTAEVFAWREGEVIKLLRPGFPDRLAEAEAAVAACVTAAGLPAPRYLGIERVEGRLGVIYARIAGPSMLDRLSARPWRVDVLARQFAGLHAQMHATAGDGLPDHRAQMRRMIERSAGTLGGARSDAVLRRLETLDEGAVVCHGDLHPGNVVVTTDGPVVIDWLTAARGPAEADVARTLFLLAGSDIPGVYPRWQRALISSFRRRFAATYLRTCRRLRPLDDRALSGWRLPMLAARLGEEIESERSSLLALIDAEIAIGERQPLRR